MPLSLSLALALALQTPIPTAARAPEGDFLSYGPYEAPEVAPERTLGYALGSRITTYRDQERALDAIAARFPRRMRRIDYGRSVEGRPLRVYVLGTEANVARWDAVLAANERVANGEKPPRDLPAIVWINETIHGNEPASFESGMALIYNLAASRNSAITNALQNALVVVNPGYNPDGHERFAVFYDSIARGESAEGNYEASEPGVIMGRTNHYRFDMNRDRISMTQDETRQEVALFLKVRPHVYVDQHGQVENYFFPPNPMAVHAGTDRARIERWTDVFGRATAASFDRQGWSYYTRAWFDLYYPGYLDSFTSLSGAIGMTHETDGGKTLAKLRSDESVVTLREGAAKHLTSALAVIGAAAGNREALVASFAEFKRKAVSGESAGAFRRVLVEGDGPALARLQGQLDRLGIKSEYLAAPYAAEATDYWTGVKARREFAPKDRASYRSGSILHVDMAQEQGPLARALFDPASDFEKKFTEEQEAKKKAAPEGEEYPGPEGAEFYDLTGWALPYAHGLKAWWSSDAEGPKRPTTLTKIGEAVSVTPDPVGYVRRYVDRTDLLAAMAARRAGVRVSVLTKETKVGGDTFPRGSFLVFRARNEGIDLAKTMEIVGAREQGWQAIGTSYPDAGTREGFGSETVASVKMPKIGVAFGSVGDLNSVGSLWWTLERELQVPFTALSNSALGTKATRDYTAIVLPPGAGSAAARLKPWVEEGGTLIVLGDSSVLGAKGLVPLVKKSGETRALPGSLFRATVDGRPLLTASYGPEIAVPFDGETFYAPKKEGGTFVRASEAKGSPLLHGWTWGKETDDAVRGAAFLHDEQVGRGHIVYFASDPTERGLYPGLERLLLNALFLVPGN